MNETNQRLVTVNRITRDPVSGVEHREPVQCYVPGSDASVDELKAAIRDSFKSSSDDAREARARRQLKTAGYALRKSRKRAWTPDDQGGYMIIDPFLNVPQAGFRYDLSLEEVEKWAAGED